MTETSQDQLDHRKNVAAAWFRSLRDSICASFEAIEDDLAGTRHADLKAGRLNVKAGIVMAVAVAK